MKCWTVLALLFAVCAVFLAVGRTEEAEDEDDFGEQVLEDVYGNSEDIAPVENALDSVNEAPSTNDEEDEPSLVKRMPWRRRRRRRRRRRFWRRVHRFFKKVCGWIKQSHHVVKWSCRLINGDEEYPRGISNDPPFLTPEEVKDLMKKGWTKKGGNTG